MAPRLSKVPATLPGPWTRFGGLARPTRRESRAGRTRRAAREPIPAVPSGHRAGVCECASWFSGMDAQRFACRISLLAVALIALIALGGCTRQRRVQYPQPQAQAQPPPAPYGPTPPGMQPNYGPQQPTYGQPAAPQATAATPATASPAATPAATTLPAVTSDPINLVDTTFLRDRTGQIHQTLIAALEPKYAAKVQTIPLVFDNEVGAVNAFAGCEAGKSFVVLTDGLLEIAANLAQAKATDDVFGGRKLDEYIRFIAQNQRPGQPIARPAQGFWLASQQVDGRKVERQHQVFDEQVAFILAHELGHHYLNHLPCTAQGGLGTSEIARVLSGTIPAFNQPNEVAADMGATQNVLRAGSRQSGYRWTEGGGLVTMHFFSGLDRLSVESILFGFESSHPAPQLRIPIIQQTAAAWRATGGQGLPFPFAL